MDSMESIKENFSQNDKRIEFDKSEFPDGGYGWFVVLAGWLAMCSVFGMVNSFGVYQTYYQTVLLPHEDAFKISLVGALQPFCIYLFAIPAVGLLHRFGIRITILIGGVIQIFSLMMLSLINSLWQLFLTQGILFGLGSAIVYLSSLTIIMQWFKTKRAIASGLSSSGSSLGGVFWPIVVKRLISEVGFAWTNRILGFIYIPICISMVFLFKSRLPLETDAKGVLPIKWTVLKDWKLLLLTLCFMLANFGLFPGLFYVDLYGKRLNDKLGHEMFDPTYLVSILNAMSLFGRIIPGFLAHRYGQINTLIPFLAISGVLPLAMWLPATKSSVLFLIYVIFWGFSSGVIVALFPPLLPQFFGVADNQSRMGWFFAIGGLGALFGPMICGSFLPLNSENSIDGFDKVAIFTGVMLLASTILLVLVRLSFTSSLWVHV